MLFRYDFDNKLDLSRFQKQALHYMGTMPEVTYHLFVFDYKMIVDVRKTMPINSKGIEPCYLVSLQIFDLKRDQDNEIIESKSILPMNDPRFNEMKDFTQIFSLDHATGDFTCDKVEIIVEKISKMIKMFNKLNTMKAFF
jgi:hypothetical protein